jgi:hypothetical protein
MARTTFLQATALRSPKKRSGKDGKSKDQPRRGLADKAANKVATKTANSRSRQSSLLLATTAQLRVDEQNTQRDAQRRARRRRQAVRHFRQVEATLARVRLPKFEGAYFQWPETLGMSHWQPSKLISLLLLAGVIALLVWVHSDERWFVYSENVTFNQLTYLKADELYQQSAVDSWNIFWLSPNAIRERLLALPTVADAQVRLQLPNQVVVDITEEQPVAMWVTQDGNFWLLPDGTALPEGAQTQPDLLQIIDPLREAKAWGDPAATRIDSAVLQSALALTTYLPAVNQIYFNQGYGLNFHLPDSDVWVYWGDGLNMQRKYTNIAAIQRHLRTAGTHPNIVDVRFEKPVLK